MLAMLSADQTQAEACLKKSIELQETAGYSYGPPSIVKPAHEFYGEWLLENNRAEEAIRMFDKALAFAPNRLLAENGKQKAEKLAGQMACIKN